MAIAAIIFSCLFFIAALAVVRPYIVLAPSLSYLGLLTLSFASTKEGYPILPINSTILWSWCYIVIIVTIATVMQSARLRQSVKGVNYMLIGAIAGMSIGLLGFSLSGSVSVLYSTMIIATAIGCFLGFVFYSRTPEGKYVIAPDGSPVRSTSRDFFKYFFAKAFPISITIMQIGVVLILLMVFYK